MRILIIGGTGMTGPFIVRNLAAAGHDVWVFHRSSADKSSALKNIIHLQGDKAELPAWRDRISDLRLDVVAHMVAYTREEAELFVATLAGVVPRSVMISSGDVYRAYGRLCKTEPGDPEPIPLREDAPLRDRLSLRGDQYDKIAVERIAQSRPEFPCTILRYPAVYGPGDGQHRLHGWVQRMDDRRPFILMGRKHSESKFPYGYVENVAAAAALALTRPEAAGRIYNVGEPDAPSRADWVRRIGHALGWEGKLVLVPDQRLPSHLAEGIEYGQVDYRQDMVLDTSRIRRELGYAEVEPLEKCLAQAITWERNHPGPHDPKKFDYAAEDALAID